MRHRRAADENLRKTGVETTRGPTRHFEALFVPGLDTLGRVGLDPGLCSFNDVGSGHDRLHHAKAERFLRAHVLALKQIHQRGLDAHQPRQPLGAAGAGEQPDHDFGQAEGDFRIVGDDAVMAGEDEFQPAAKRQAIDRGRHRLAAGFKVTQQLVELEHAVEQRRHLRFAFGQFGARTEHGAHALQVGASHEARRLARREDRALYGRIGLQPLDGGGEVTRHFRRDDVHRLAGDIDGEEEDAIGIEFGTDCGVGHLESPLLPSRMREGSGVGEHGRGRGGNAHPQPLPQAGGESRCVQ